MKSQSGIFSTTTPPSPTGYSGRANRAKENHNHTGDAHHEHDHVDRADPVLDLFLEANGNYREAAETSGVVDGNTGGNVIFLSGIA